MIVAPLADSRSARSLCEVLLAHGWDDERARETATGMEAAAFHGQQLSPEVLQSLVVTAGRLGLEVITGEDWALLSGARSRLTALARPWSVPPELSAFSLALAEALRDEGGPVDG
ncbi:MAG: hypothetical protein KJZ47_10930 [Gemmatimonadales bacterium]|nr:hypothetical protein [Gemmatimonadales bacterium]